MIRKLTLLLLASLALAKPASADYKEICVAPGDIQDEELSCYYHFKYNQGMNLKCYVRLDIPPKGKIGSSAELISLGDLRAKGNNVVSSSLNTCKACYPGAMVILFKNYQRNNALATSTAGLRDYTSNLGIGNLTPISAPCNNPVCAIEYFGPSLCPCEKDKPCARQMGTTCDLCNPPYAP